MSAVLEQPRLRRRSLAEVLRELGDIPPSRIRVDPPIGTATEDDLILSGKPVCELIDATLVEKAMGFFEGRIAFVLAFLIEQWLADKDLGFVNGEGAFTRMEHGNVRVPDVSVFRWDRVGTHRVPKDPICGVVPNLAIEVLSRENTHQEIERKRQEYFASGVELVWIIEPELQTVEIWTSARDCHIADRRDVLDGGRVLPGFQLSIAELFSRAEGNPQPTA